MPGSSWFRGIAALLRRTEIDDGLWDELEELLIGGDVGPALADELLTELRKRSRSGELRTSADVEQALQQELVGLLRLEAGVGGWGLGVGSRGPDAAPKPQTPTPRPQTPQLVLVVGVNGVGKTTTVAKLAHYWQRAGRKVLLAAADTFRAAGAEQLELWAERAHLPCVRGQRGGDPGAVVFDALAAAQARGLDLVLADTAGRLHTKINLMDELGKLARIAERQSLPVSSLLVLDASTGQNGIAQARGFRASVGLAGIVLAKLDGTAKGGAVFSIVRELGAPVLFAGTGEGIEDLVEFDPESFVAGLFEE